MMRLRNILLLCLLVVGATAFCTPAQQPLVLQLKATRSATTVAERRWNFNEGPTMSNLSTNPYGLTAGELYWNLNRGSSQESAAAQERRLQADLMAGQARIRRLEGLVREGGGNSVERPVALDPQFQTGGKYALSTPEQLWATGGAAASLPQAPLTQQLDRKRDEVAAIQKSLQSIQQEQHAPP
jgi:hypothetical protein